MEVHHVIITRMPRLDHRFSQILHLPEHLRRHEPPKRLQTSTIRSIGSAMIRTTRRLSIGTAEPESPATILRRTGKQIQATTFRSISTGTSTRYRLRRHGPARSTQQLSSVLSVIITIVTHDALLSAPGKQ
jgi:hypothetical protein